MFLHESFFSSAEPESEIGEPGRISQRRAYSAGSLACQLALR